MKEKILSPHAASLSQSMRDLGYSLETAIADLIDNSITAKAKNIRIFLELPNKNPACLAIIDDGFGMTENQLLEAMRPGSRNPREVREVDDLGRFGLGLKTASFSQCKTLTVISRRNRRLCAAQWDLDLITKRNEWIVTILSAEEIKDLPFVNDLGIQGTCVLWQKLDRLIENNAHDRARYVNDKLTMVENHLALVFHRYLSGDYRKQKVTIQINGHGIDAFDPFCTSNKATQMLPEERVRFDEEEVLIQPYILPHHSKLSKKDYDFYRSRSDFVSNQGAYIYRNGRLMAWGDWFNLVPKSEATKLARVKIDFSNALDEYWTIDIKKSRAHPPPQVREKLRHIVNRITDQSKLVHTGRGKRLFEENTQPLWVRYGDRAGIRYSVNREHPLVISFQKSLNSADGSVFEDVLSVIERSLPLEAIYADYSATPQSFEELEDVSAEDLERQIKTLHILLCSSGAMDSEGFAKIVYGLKPFRENKKIVDRIIKELSS